MKSNDLSTIHLKNLILNVQHRQTCSKNQQNYLLSLPFAFSKRAPSTSLH